MTAEEWLDIEARVIAELRNRPEPQFVELGIVQLLFKSQWDCDKEPVDHQTECSMPLEWRAWHPRLRRRDGLPALLLLEVRSDSPRRCEPDTAAPMTISKRAQRRQLLADLALLGQDVSQLAATGMRRLQEIKAQLVATLMQPPAAAKRRRSKS
jgi:hypothetical protein